MKEKTDREWAELRVLLRAADPATYEPPLDGSERREMCERAAAMASQDPPDRASRKYLRGWPVLRTAMAAVGLLAVVGLSLLLAHRSEIDPEALDHALPGRTPAEQVAHQVQFTTESGTLIVWIPDKDVDPRP